MGWWGGRVWLVVGWLVGWLVVWLGVYVLVAWLLACLLGWLVGWLVGCAGWLVGWLFGWLLGCVWLLGSLLGCLVALGLCVVFFCRIFCTCFDSTRFQRVKLWCLSMTCCFTLDDIFLFIVSFTHAFHKTCTLYVSF